MTIENMAYSPAALTVRAGETVTWVNKDIFPHTVTAAGSFDSHELAPGARWTYRATAAGDFAYLCTLHPNMKGMLKVQ